MKELKITIKFNVNFLSMSLKDTFSSQCLFFERAVDFMIYLYYNKNVGSPFFIKFLFSKPVHRRFSIIKVFLKNFANLTEIYICQHLFSDEVEGCRLKRVSGAGAFL